MEYRKSIDQIKKEARSESMNKWIGRIENETELITEGNTPTEKMEDLIAKIKQAINSGDNFDYSLNELIKSSYEQGIQGGFAKALSKLSKGAITTRKVRNEDYWELHTNSKQYQISARLPTVDDGEQKITVKIKLSEHGFEC
jgi:cobalamin biosynthesis protein CbiD